MADQVNQVQPEPSGNGNGMGMGLIIGIVVVILVLLALIFFWPAGNNTTNDTIETQDTRGTESVGGNNGGVDFDLEGEIPIEEAPIEEGGE